MHRIASITAAALPFIICSQAPAAESVKVEFAPVEVPASDAERQAVRASPEVVIGGNTFAIEQRVLARPGDRIGEGVFGRIVAGRAQPQDKGAGSPTGSSLITAGNRVVEVAAFGGSPGAIYVTELNQDEVTGELTATATVPVDLAVWGGAWRPGAGSPTPWGSALASEVSPPNARAVEAANRKEGLPDNWAAWARNFGLAVETASLADLKKAFNPYLWGYATEIKVEGPTAAARKHYAMGRAAAADAIVMPDRKTVYYSDFGGNAGFYMFVADAPSDLSAGRLYALKWKQKGAERGGSADVSWIDLGHAASAEIRAAIDGGITFSQIFETAKGDDRVGTCPSGFKAVNAAHGFECLKLKTGMETAASRLETRRYAAYQGATTEFAAEGGIAFSAAARTLYLAVGSIGRGVARDPGAQTDVRLAGNECGAVYGLEVAADATIGSDYVARTMAGVVAGLPKAGGPGRCDVDGIANPRSLAVLADSDVLVIGEDGDGHANDAVWALDARTGGLTRMATLPDGFGAAAMSWTSNLDGWGYLMTAIRARRGDAVQGADDQHGYVGYLGPFPAFSRHAEEARRPGRHRR